VLQQYLNYRVCTWFAPAEQLMVNDYTIKRHRTNAIYVGQNKRGGNDKNEKKNYAQRTMELQIKTYYYYYYRES
jgi:isocitrate/isopropylmalate dehydrogenase